MRLAESSNACQVLSVELPPSCDRRRCRLGFEKTGQENVIHIDTGIRYQGNNETFRSFCEDGRFSYINEVELDVFLSQLDEVAHEQGLPSSEGVCATPIASASTSNALVREFDEQTFLNTMSSKIKGQNAAIATACSLLSSSTRKVNPTKPLSLLLPGPTGVGKTLFGDTLAEAISACTGVTYSSLRIDMNQLADRFSASRFYGSPPGYVGYDDPPLFETLRANPRTVVLFDEMEKADPRVMYVLMNAMASGRMEASRVSEDGNRIFDFARCVMVFTTNIALDVEEGLPQWEMTRQCKQQLRDYRSNGYQLPPEIISRFSEVIAFSPISNQVRLEIAELSIARLAFQFGLNLLTTQKDLLKAFSDICVSEEGVREYEYMAERFFGRTFADYLLEANSNDIKLKGSLDAQTIQPVATTTEEASDE